MIYMRVSPITGKMLFIDPRRIRNGYLPTIYVKIWARPVNDVRLRSVDYENVANAVEVGI